MENMAYEHAPIIMTSVVKNISGFMNTVYTKSLDNTLSYMTKFVYYTDMQQKSSHKKTKLPFHIVLLGQIASGKDTQAKILANKYNFTLVESGLFTRNVMTEKSKRGDDFRRSAGKGNPAPMKYMKEFFLEQIITCPTDSRLLFLGGPRLKPEAQLLYKLLKARKDHVIALYISLPEKEVYKRSIKRNESAIDEIYKVFDQDTRMITKRLKFQKEQVMKSVNYFKDHIPFKAINGNQPISKVTLDIHKALVEFLTQMTP